MGELTILGWEHSYNHHELTYSDLQMISNPEKNVKGNYEARHAISTVFKTTESQSAFVHGLIHLARDLQAKISLTGRRLRELVGYQTLDLAPEIVSDAHLLDISYVPQTSVCRPFIEFLKKYPNHLLKPDIDLSIIGIPLNTVTDTYHAQGFQVEQKQILNGVHVVDVFGEHGRATFSSSDSWHIGPPWPKLYSIHADLKIENEETALFSMNHNWGTFHAYPLECPGIGLGEFADPTEKRRFASVARALLGSFSAVNPEGYLPRLPFVKGKGREDMYSTVSQVVPLLNAINQGLIAPDSYASSLRDMALALFNITPPDHCYDWDAASGSDFFGRIRGAYMSGFAGGIAFISFPSSK